MSVNISNRNPSLPANSSKVASAMFDDVEPPLVVKEERHISTHSERVVRIMCDFHGTFTCICSKDQD